MKKTKPNYGSDTSVPLDSVIASIDIETLGLHQDAVVFDIGVVLTKILPPPGVLWGLADLDILDPSLISHYRVKLPVMPQVLAGRTVDVETVKFHSRVLAKLNTTIEKVLDAPGQATLDSARATLAGIFNATPVSEVWFNHPQFDSTRICSTLFGGNPDALPWRFNQEFDVASAKKVFTHQYNRENTGAVNPLEFKGYKAQKHDSIADCLYNLSALSVSLYHNIGEV